MARFISCAHLFLLIRFVNADIFSKLFEKKIGFNDNGSATMSSAHSFSAVHCVRQGLNRKDCIAVVYHNESQVCTFIDSVETVTDISDVGYAYIFIGDHCQSGWIGFNGSCYLFGNQKYNWSDAMDFCINEGATLVEIETPPENHFIQDTLSTIENPNHWIGMTDSEQEGVWVWASGIIAGYLDWGRDQPYNGRGAQCGAIMESFEYEWVDEPCSVLFYPLCEKVSASRPY